MNIPFFLYETQWKVLPVSQHRLRLNWVSNKKSACLKLVVTHDGVTGHFNQKDVGEKDKPLANHHEGATTLQDLYSDTWTFARVSTLSADCVPDYGIRRSSGGPSLMTLILRVALV